jgi:hypothetical protein
MLSHHVARISWKRRTASGAMTWALSMDGIALRIVGIAKLENPLFVRLPYLAAFPQANRWLLPGLIHKSRAACGSRRTSGVALSWGHLL